MQIMRTTIIIDDALMAAVPDVRPFRLEAYGAGPQAILFAKWMRRISSPK
jgi:hypothetical protein